MRCNRRFQGLILLIVLMIMTACEQSSEARIEVQMEAQVLSNEVHYTKVALQEDFQRLEQSILSEHPKIYTDIDALTATLKSQYTLIEEGMTQREFLQILAPIVSKLNCGHTTISYSEDYQQKLSLEALYFPLPVHFIEGRAYVVQNGMDPRVPLGAELLSINGRSIQAIRQELFSFLSADGTNETHKDFLLNGWFRYYFYNFIDNSKTYELAFQTEDKRETKQLVVKGATNDDMTAINKPLYQENSEPYTSRFEEKYAVLSMYSFYPYGGYTITDFKAFIDSFFLDVKEKHIDQVILDVRENGGGDPYITSHLFSYLAKVSQPYFTQDAIDYYDGLKSNVPLAQNHYSGKLYTLMSGGSFSSTGHLLALLKHQNIGTFIGEESGASYACTDASYDILLPQTQIHYRTSTLAWAVDVNGLSPGRGIMPDINVIQPIADYLNNRDTVMNAAVSLVEGQ